MGFKKRKLEELSYSKRESHNIIEDISISKDDHPYLFEEQLKELLEKNIEGKSNLILGVLIGINEVVDNILEHSDGGEFKQYDRVLTEAGTVSAQYYKDTNHLVVTIWDFGKGIIGTLSQEYDDLSEKEVLQKAFEYNVTRHRKLSPNRGNGLAKLKEFVLESKGSIICQTNGLEITFSPLYSNGYITESLDKDRGTQFEVKIGCSSEINIYPFFNTDTFEEFFEFEENTTLIEIKNFMPLNSHQQGIKVKTLILNEIRKSNDKVRLDFYEVEIFSDSFIQEIITILSQEIGFDLFKEKVRFTNLNESLLKMVQEKIYIASGS